MRMIADYKRVPSGQIIKGTSYQVLHDDTMITIEEEYEEHSKVFIERKQSRDSTILSNDDLMEVVEKIQIMQT